MSGPRINDARLPAETTRTDPSTTTYVVVEHDTLTGVAARLSNQLGRRVTVEELCRLNPQFDLSKVGGGNENRRVGQRGWDPDLIRTGEQLIVPAAPAGTPKAAESPVEPKAAVGPADQLDSSRRPSTPNQMAPERTSPEVGIAPQNRNQPVRDSAAVEQKAGTEQTASAAQTAPPTEPQAAGAADPAVEEKPPSTFSKIFGTMRKIFQHPLFQGALAIMATLPGLGVLASAVGLCTGLLSSIGAMVEDPTKPPWVTLGSTLLYGVGAFVPGLGKVGAFGGLAGMMACFAPGNPGMPRAKRQPAEAERPPAPPPRSEPLSATDYDDRFRRVSQNPQAIADPLAFGEWLAAASDLQQERALLRQRLAGEQLDATARQQLEGRRAQLDRLLGLQLPDQVLAQTAAAAFGLGDVVAAETPTSGRLYALGDGETLESVAGRIAGSAQPAELVAAIRSFNGIPAEATLAAGNVVYIPSAEQLERRPAAGWPARWPMDATDGAHQRDRLQQVLELFGDDPALAVARANQLFAIFRNMPVAPVEQPVHSAVEADERVAVDEHPEV